MTQCYKDFNGTLLKLTSDVKNYIIVEIFTFLNIFFMVYFFKRVHNLLLYIFPVLSKKIYNFCTIYQKHVNIGFKTMKSVII